MSHIYEIGEPVSELVGIAAAIIDGQSEDHELMSSCPQCALTCRYGAEIRDERITRVWLLPKNQGRRLER